jgi:hypothetical protein
MCPIFLRMKRLEGRFRGLETHFEIDTLRQFFMSLRDTLKP